MAGSALLLGTDSKEKRKTLKEKKRLKLTKMQLPRNKGCLVIPDITVAVYF